MSQPPYDMEKKAPWMLLILMLVLFAMQKFGFWPEDPMKPPEQVPAETRVEKYGEYLCTVAKQNGRDVYSCGMFAKNDPDVFVSVECAEALAKEQAGKRCPDVLKKLKLMEGKP